MSINIIFESYKKNNKHNKFKNEINTLNNTKLEKFSNFNNDEKLLNYNRNKNNDGNKNLFKF